MKKILFVFAVLSAAALSTFAQTTTSSPASEGGKFSIGFDGGIPIGDASDVYTFIVGGSIKYELPTVTNTFFTLSAGYNSWLVKGELKDMGFPSTSNFIPLKAGIKYYPGDGFFLEGAAGIVFATESGVGSSFTYAPGLGYTFKGGLEAAVRFESWPKKDDATLSQIGLRVAYRF
jgi:hypothetical protein